MLSAIVQLAITGNEVPSKKIAPPSVPASFPVMEQSVMNGLEWLKNSAPPLVSAVFWII